MRGEQKEQQPGESDKDYKKRLSASRSLNLAQERRAGVPDWTVWNRRKR